ncbi:PTS sugar transporter subunit IIB [Bacillus ginsengihumi]|uniref:PTS fructose transporter subunit IIB n=1 Tax=Heyndrickxia ginsengihumi TaxID=363870 RepID=A0A0A6VAF1_9BACI|nr:PTS sugar transporter subunit IIB [Heyndrickxia ginsengihumi]KHD84488.1 PTS fructose transporter subunit IIB [Heyndrickxia ginsengihumi]NEY19307.1 PTS sugar transporter subunit IIB [Heyndrickxia ginsengihumi]
MKTFKILSVCGSGTVTSSMVAQKLKEEMEVRGIRVTTNEGKPTEALSFAQSGAYDLITHTSPLPKADYGIPTISSISCLTGIGEEEFFDEVEAVLRSLAK